MLGTVPTDAAESGRLLHTFDSKGEQDIVYDPLTTSGNAVRRLYSSPFPGDMIPASRFNTISQNVLKFYPEPNRAGQGPADYQQLLHEWEVDYKHG